MANRLNVAVVHYHLKPGGVTRVVENTEQAFAESSYPVELAVLVGPSEDNQSNLKSTRIIPDLGYSPAAESPDPGALVEQLRSAARDLLGAEPDLWHIHNHSLGKNPALSAAIAHLADAGEAVLLQIHDFAEDGRAENYRELSTCPDLLKQLYPLSNRIGYAVLNGRDYRNLHRAGVPEDSLYSLPNAVQTATPPDSPHDFRNWDAAFAPYTDLILYPVRATRRKNFGELLLWAILESGSTSDSGWEKPLFANTLGPSNPDFAKTFDRWKAFIDEHDLPVQLALADTVDAAFAEVVGASSAVLTTSVAEGFGLGFLEPWLFRKPLAGRDLPEITRDFTDHGITLDGLYNRLDVPLEWIGGRDSLLRHLRPAMETSFKAYDTPLQTADVDRALQSICRDERVDFGRIDEPLQERVLKRLIRDSAARSAVSPHTLGSPPAPETIDRNREIVEKEYSLASYAERLHTIYRRLLDAPGDQSVQYLDPDAVLSAFLNPESYNLLRA